jgi:hypothetical protein
MTEATPGSTRIGNSERESAMNALDVHLSAGRLDSEEYGERVGRVSVARVAADLEPLFSDLPAPHPVIGSAPARVAPTAPATNLVKRKDDNHGRPALGGKLGETVVASSPIIAVILFFATNSFFDQSWLFFLLIPLAGAVVYGRGWRGE